MSVCKNSTEVISNIQALLEAHSPIKSIGFGNSVTLQELGLTEVVESYTDTLYVHKPVGINKYLYDHLTAGHSCF